MSSQITASAVPAEHRILRRAEVEAKTGFKRAHIYSLMKEGKFGARQDTCRLSHAVIDCFALVAACASTTASRSGFKVTAPIGAQLRVARDQRAGLRARAWT